MHPATFTAFCLFALPAAAQRILNTTTLPGNTQVRQLRPAGDTSGDGRGDFVALLEVYDPQAQQYTSVVQVVSGASGAVLQTLASALGANIWDAVGIGDVNNDGRSDIAVANTWLRVYSGANGAQLAGIAGTNDEFYLGVCSVGDWDGDGSPDLAGVAGNASTGQLVVRVRRGNNLAPLLALTPVPPSGSWESSVRDLGDLSGDGKAEIALATFQGPLYALRSDAGGIAWTATTPDSDGQRRVETLDIDGDGRNEAIHLRRNALIATVYGSDGLARFTITGTLGYNDGVREAGCAIGDLDADGFQDFALGFFATNGEVNAYSGRTGQNLWTLRGSAPRRLGRALASLGDVDGDGFVDLVAATETGVPTIGEQWHIVSGRILADSQPKTGACGAGAFFPRLGMSRPILGQTATIQGLDGPLGVNGVLVWSLRPLYPTSLGASSCAAWFDLGSGMVLAPLTQPQWTLAIPLPAVPQLAGLELALQSYYAPTAGALGYDLSNGVWLRLGHQ